MDARSWENEMNYDTVDAYVQKFSREIMTQPAGNLEGWACQQVYNEFLSDLNVESVIELGAGAGTLLYMFPDNIQRDGLSMGKERPEYIEGDMNTPPIGDKEYELVLARHCVEHSLVPMVMLCEMARITKRYALVVVPVCSDDIAEMINHYAVFTPTSWRAMFKKAGFKILREKLNNPIYEDNVSNYFEDRFLLSI
jgi:hypothetical protein